MTPSTTLSIQPHDPRISGAASLTNAGRQTEDAATALIDACGRRIDHLRLSVTSRCNLRCRYCRPDGEREASAADLTDENRLELVRHLHFARGLRQLRITGGEPLLHLSLLALIRSIRHAMPRLRIAITTNGWRLADLARDLFNAGLDRINVSVDTLDPAAYRSLTGGEIAPVLDGIRRCIDAGFPPPRINAVVLRGINDQSMVNLVEWALDSGLELRFLEAMPIGPAAAFNRANFVSADWIRDHLSSAFKLTPIPRESGETAQRYGARRGHRQGVIGIIAPVTERFCGQCRRMRLTADGRLFPCLLDDRHVDLGLAWAAGAFRPEVADELIHSAIQQKQPRGDAQQRTAMIQLGG